MRAPLKLVGAACCLAVIAGTAAGAGMGAASPARIVPVRAQARPAPVVRAPVLELRTPRQRRMAAVVRAWSSRLNANDNAGIARLFTLPAVMVQGPFVYRLTTRAQVAAWHAGLPCAGRIESITFRGRFVTAVFRLANRGSRQCDAPGSRAAARFEIVGGKIRSWQQVAVPREQPTGPTA